MCTGCGEEGGPRSRGPSGGPNPNIASPVLKTKRHEACSKPLRTVKNSREEETPREGHHPTEGGGSLEIRGTHRIGEGRRRRLRRRVTGGGGRGRAVYSPGGTLHPAQWCIYCTPYCTPGTPCTHGRGMTELATGTLRSSVRREAPGLCSSGLSWAAGL